MIDINKLKAIAGNLAGNQNARAILGASLMAGGVGVPVGQVIMAHLNQEKLRKQMQEDADGSLGIAKPRGLIMARTVEKATEHFLKQNPELSNYQKDMAVSLIAQAMAMKNNAFFSMPSEKAKGVKPAVFVSKGVNPKVLAHEVGHYLDAQALGAGTSEEFRKKFHPILSALYGLVLAGEHSPTYKRELAAWEQSGVEKGDPLREAALKTYKRSLNMTGTLGASLGMYVLGKRLLQMAG